MRIERMREVHPPEKLAELYSEPHDHTKFEDHLLRVDATIALARWLVRDIKTPSVADLSCGNGEIVKRLCDPYYDHDVHMSPTYLGDFAPGYEYHGPIEETINQIPRVDLFICSETIEHLDAPEHVLRRIRNKASRLVLSTPINETVADANQEHYWAWDVEGVADLLRRTGWMPVVRQDLSYYDWFFPYNFQIWGCK